MSQRQTKHQLHPGGSFDKPAQMTFDFRRVGTMRMRAWTASDRRYAKKWLEDVKHSFELFIAETEIAIEQSKPVRYKKAKP